MSDVIAMRATDGRVGRGGSGRRVRRLGAALLMLGCPATLWANPIVIDPGVRDLFPLAMAMGGECLVATIALHRFFGRPGWLFLKMAVMNVLSFVAFLAFLVCGLFLQHHTGLPLPVSVVLGEALVIIAEAGYLRHLAMRRTEALHGELSLKHAFGVSFVGNLTSIALFAIGVAVLVARLDSTSVLLGLETIPKTQ